MPQTSIQNHREGLPPRPIRRRNMQRDKRIRPRSLPLLNPLLKRILTIKAQSRPIIRPVNIVAEINRLRHNPDGAIDPVAVVERAFGRPPLLQTVVEGGEA